MKIGRLNSKMGDIRFDLNEKHVGVGQQTRENEN
jgi:hypothetical protein